MTATPQNGTNPTHPPPARTTDAMNAQNAQQPPWPPPWLQWLRLLMDFARPVARFILVFAAVPAVLSGIRDVTRELASLFKASEVTVAVVLVVLVALALPAEGKWSLH